MNKCCYCADIHDRLNVCTNFYCGSCYGKTCIESCTDQACEDHVEELVNDINYIDTTDAVNHPSHYCQGGIECIKAIEASMTPEEFQGYCKGNVIKYVWRFREKNGLEDLKKAQVYLGWMIESKEKQEESK